MVDEFTHLFHFFAVMPTIVKTLGKENPFKHMKKMSTAILTAFSTCSSGATLPISLRDSEGRCGISNKIASFTLPLGATINMNGTALYECAAVVFIAQAYGIEMSLMQQVVVVQQCEGAEQRGVVGMGETVLDVLEREGVLHLLVDGFVDQQAQRCGADAGMGESELVFGGLAVVVLGVHAGLRDDIC